MGRGGGVAAGELLGTMVFVGSVLRATSCSRRVESVGVKSSDWVTKPSFSTTIWYWVWLWNE